MNGGGAGLRIPNDVQRKILDVKEVVRNTSDEEIHAMLEECCMNAEEATQRLLELESFEMVISKREKKRQAKNKAAAEYNNRRSVPRSRGVNGYNGNPVFRQASNGSTLGTKSSSGPKENLNKENKKPPLNLPVPSEAKRKESDLLSPVPDMTNGVLNTRCDNAVKKLVPVADQNEILKSSRSAGSDPVCVSAAAVVNPKREVRAQQTERVIIAQHLHVPESERGEFRFGSFNVNSNENAEKQSPVNVSEFRFGSFNVNSNENAEKQSLVQDSLIAPVVLDGDNEGQELSAPVPDSLSTEKEQSKQEITDPFAVSQSSSAQITDNISLFTPKIRGGLSDLNNSDRHLSDASRLLSFAKNGSTPFVLPNSGSTQLTSQLMGVVQSPMASTQPPIPALYNYPQNPYYMPHMNYYNSSYYPPTHNFMGNAASLQQPSASVFPTPVQSATTGNLLLPQFRFGVNTDTQTHNLPRGNGPYTSSITGSSSGFVPY